MTALEFRIFLKALVLPPSGLLILGVAGLLVWWRRPRIGFALCAASIGSLWLLATPIVSDALAHVTEGYPAFDPAHLTEMQTRAQAIVILGGGVRRNAPEVGGDAPGIHAGLRLIEGARVARATRLPILISGSPREAAAMRHFMEEDLQLPVRWVEGASKDTRENAVFSARLLRQEGIDRVILVTSSEHMVRAAAEFTAAGLEVTAAPAGMWTHDEPGPLGFVPSISALDRSRTCLYEWIGRLLQTR